MRFYIDKTVRTEYEDEGNSNGRETYRFMLYAFNVLTVVYMRTHSYDQIMQGETMNRGSEWRVAHTNPDTIEAYLSTATLLSDDDVRLMFRYGYYFIGRLGERMADSIRWPLGRKFITLLDNRKARLDGLKGVNCIEYKGGKYSSAFDYEMRSYHHKRRINQDLNKTFVELLKNHTRANKEAFESAFLALYVDRHRDSSFLEVFEKMDGILNDHDIYIDLEQASTCEHIEHTDAIEGRVGINGDEYVCNACYEEHYVHVEDVGEYWHRNDACWDEYHEAYYSEPQYHEDDDDPDYNEDDSGALMSYSTNVMRILEPDHSIQSSKHGDFRMGIEFEMLCGHGKSRRDAVNDVRDQLGQDYCVCKQDGSLDDREGLEIVTAPRGLAEHIQRFKAWNIDSSYRAWDAESCGMHIHIHSLAFTPLTLGKFIMLFNSEDNMDFIRKIAGRHPLKDRQAESYCALDTQKRSNNNPNVAIKGKSSSRYRIINTENLSVTERVRLKLNVETNGKKYDTIELRIFRASLKKERLLAQIEFAHACVMFCRVASWAHLDKMHFIEWLKTTNNMYPHLSDWYGLRRRPKKQESLLHPTHQAQESICADQS